MRDRRAKARSIAVPAKISPPRLSDIYRRDRLFRVLDKARKKRAVWIAAPAGAGKTSLVASYLYERRVPAIWYNVDARDADVANLFHFLAIAARLAKPQRKLTIPAFKTEHQAGVAAFTRGFFELLSRERPLSSVIVLDDYHEANSQLWDRVIGEGICALPRNQCLLIVSRAEPPPAFSRLIATGEIASVGPDELRLTPREMKGLVHLCRPDLRGEAARSSVERACALANGWAAALTLLMQERDVGAFSQVDLEHRSERLFDYFATEILDKLTPIQQGFLLKTSVAPRIDAALAEHLTGIEDAPQILVNLERRGFLTQRLGSSGAYRYHPLLREFLLRRAARQLGSDVLRQLHRRAADSLANAGLIDEAMEQLENARDVAARVELILRTAPSYVAAGRSRTVERWIAQVPRQCVESHGWLAYWEAVACVDHAPSRARDLLEGAYNNFANAEDTAGLYSSSAAAIQAIVHEGVDFSRLDPWVLRIDQMRAQGLPCPEVLRPMVATGMLMASTFRRRDPEQGRYWAEQAMRLAMKGDDFGHRVMTGGLLAFYFALHDDAARAAAILEMLRVIARAAEVSSLPVLTVLQADALCSWVRGDNATCVARAREALDLAARTGIFAWNVYLQTMGVAAALSCEDAAATREFLEQLAHSVQTGVPFLVGAYHFNASWEALSRGDIARALHSADLACQNAELVGYPVANCVANLVRANALFRSGRTAEAVAALTVSRRHAADIDSSYLLHGCDLVEADFLWESDRDNALHCLKRGLKIARTRNYQNMFCLSRALKTRNAERALEHQIETVHVRENIALHRLKPHSPRADLDDWPWRFRFHALGSFSVESADPSASHGASEEGRRVTVRGKPLRLLRAIVALGGREVTETSLIDALWPDAEGDAGRRVFDTTLHRLRRQLGDDHVLRLVQGRVGLDEGSCWLDLWAAEHLFAEVVRQIERDPPVSLVRTLADRLLYLYRGPLLVDESASWAGAPRHRLAAKFEHAARDVGRALEARGDFGQAARLYQRMREENPLSECAYAGLMRCALRAGRHADAVRLFEECRTTLATELQSAPGSELSDLWSTLAAGRADLDTR